MNETICDRDTSQQTLKEDVGLLFFFHVEVQVLRKLCSEKLSEAQIFPSHWSPILRVSTLKELPVSMQFRRATPRPAFQEPSFHAAIKKYSLELHLSYPLTYHQLELSPVSTGNCKGAWK